MSAGPLIRGACVFMAGASGILAVAFPPLGWIVGPVCLLGAMVAANYVPEKEGHA